MGFDLRIDRDRFLLLAAAIAGPSCGPTREPTTSAIIAPPVAEPVASTAPSVEDSGPPSVEDSGGASGCDNDVGTVQCDAIRKRDIGPACESLTGACDMLAKGTYGFRMRAAQAAAACWQRIGPKVCDIYARGRCNLEAVRAACPEPKYESKCRAIMDTCTKSGQKIRYTITECMQSLSAHSDKERDWVASAMGPSKEGCKLEHIVY